MLYELKDKLIKYSENTIVFCIDPTTGTIFSRADRD